MTRLAIIFSLLFATPAWAGEVDGKSFFCNSPSPHLKPYALVFEAGKARLYDPAEVIKGKYRANAGYVEWEANHHKMGFNTWRIDRKTLKLSRGHPRALSFVDHRQCEISSKRAAINRVKELRDAKELKAREGNKF